MKSFRYVRLTDKILGDYTQEVAMLRKLKHPNIVLFIGACTNPKLLILTEYCSRKRYDIVNASIVLVFNYIASTHFVFCVLC